MASVTLLLFCSILAVPQDHQGRSPVVARYLLDGVETSVSRDDLALELAQRFQRQERGRTALQHMIDLTLVRREAARKKIHPSTEEVEKRMKTICDALEAGKRSLEVALKQAGMTRAEFADEYAALSLAHERLVRDELGGKGQDPVAPSLLELWLKQARDRLGVVDAPDQLPAGIVARIGRGNDTFDLSALDLGRVLLRTAQAEERQRYTNQIVVCRILGARAARAGIGVTQDEIDQEIRERRADIEKRASQGMTFEQMLATQGSSVEQLARSPVLRAQVLERKLVEKEHPAADLERQIETQRDIVEKKHGARRRLAILFLRAAKEPNALIKRDFAAARKHAEELRTQVADGKPFDLVVALNSEDPETKKQGGDAGWHHALEKSFPTEVLAEAFTLAKGAIGVPVQTKEGIVLVKVTDVEPPPAKAELLERLRREHADDYRERLLADAKVRFVES
jgi:parvulin-like peptidyl-prolyl isomerase